MHVVATAGHVDHGKSTLVLALTGTDPDRWKEEKERGLTIDLGFANTTLASGAQVAFVDVPGHVRFIRNMLAGVGAVDACLFVVAATEGWKPQSEEHLRILDLFGLRAGLVALTKAALVDRERLRQLEAEVGRRLADSGLAGAKILAVDSITGLGIDRLAESLDLLLSVTPRASDADRPRLWVDRSFAARGSGTVVTGTLTGGRMSDGDSMTIVGPGPAPAGAQARIRALQTHGDPRSWVDPGHRVAVNLAGIGHREVIRGDALVRQGQWWPSRTFDVSLRVLGSLGHPVSRRGAYAFYAGSGEHAATLRVIGASELQPGERGFARVHIGVDLPLLPGDRYILREHGRGETVGGGEILDVDPVLPASRARPSRSIERVVAERGWVDSDVLYRLTGIRRGADVGGRWVVDPAVLAGDRRRLREKVSKAGPWGVDLALLDERERALLASMDDPPPGDTEAPADSLAEHPFLRTLEDLPWSAPAPASFGADRLALRAMLQRGMVVERDGVYFAASAVERAARVVAGLLASAPEGVTVAALRDALGASRKTVLPLLSYFDATGVTRRRGDRHVAGPLLPRSAVESRELPAPNRSRLPPGPNP